MKNNDFSLFALVPYNIAIFQAPPFPKATFSTLVPIWASLGPQQKIDRSFLAPLGLHFASPHAFRTLSGPSKKRPERKMKPLKPLQDLPQKSSPDYVLQIQDLPKRTPVDLISFPEGSLGSSWGAPPTFGALPGPSWNPTGAIQQQKHVFLDNH